MVSPARIGLIIPSADQLTENQFHRYCPDGVTIHVTRLRLPKRRRLAMAEIDDAIAEAAPALADVGPGVIVFHYPASMLGDAAERESRFLDIIEEATDLPAVSTGRAVIEALHSLGVGKLVLITPYDEATGQTETRYLEDAGFEVIHELGLGLSGVDEYIMVPAQRWQQITISNARDDADGYLLSCTNTNMIAVIEACERHLRQAGHHQQPGRPVGLPEETPRPSRDRRSRPAVRSGLIVGFQAPVRRHSFIKSLRR